MIIVTPSDYLTRNSHLAAISVSVRNRVGKENGTMVGQDMGYATVFLGRKVVVEIDRPLGSIHPQHGFEYLVNYGYIPDTKAPDGEPVDAYVLGISEPLETFAGKCIAVIHRTDDDDDKLIVVPDGISFTNEEIQKTVHFQEQFFKSVIIRCR